MAQRRSRADTMQGRGTLRPARDSERLRTDPRDRPFPWEPLFDTSVFDPAWETGVKRVARTLIPSTPREVSTELLLAALGGPVVKAAAKGVSRVSQPAIKAIRKYMNIPFDPTKRRTLGTLLGKDTLENVQRRDVLLTRGFPPKLLRKTFATDWPPLEKVKQLQAPHLGGVNPYPTAPPLSLGQGEAQRRIAESLAERAVETASGRGGILGDIIEHGNVLSRKIREEALEEAGGVIKEEAPGEATAAFIDNLLRRLGVRGKP
jgi:hypothetical protein